MKLNPTKYANLRLHIHATALALGGLFLLGSASCEKAPQPELGGATPHEGEPTPPPEQGSAEDDHDDHEGGAIQDGPNGGRLLTAIEPHAEFFVTDGRTVHITFVDDDKQPLPLSGQSVAVIAGDRSAPTRLAFEEENGILISDGTLPEGNNFPVVVQITPAAGADVVTEKFNLNLDECPTCDNKEYACICDHEHDE